jgi:hypothetical protein
VAELTSRCSVELSPSFQLGMAALMEAAVDPRRRTSGDAAPAEREDWEWGGRSGLKQQPPKRNVKRPQVSGTHTPLTAVNGIRQP